MDSSHQIIQPTYESIEPLTLLGVPANLSSNDPLITLSEKKVAVKVEVDRFSETKLTAR